MVFAFRQLKQMNCSALGELYQFPNSKEEIDFMDHLRDVFFRTAGAVYYVWIENGRYIAALRLEPWDGKLLLSGFQTHPSYRRRGYGLMLMQEVLRDHVHGTVCSHIHHKNYASIALHLKAGFRKAFESARLLDGTVTSQYGTYVFG